MCVQAEGSHCLSPSSLLSELSCLLFQTRAKAAWQLGGLTALLFSGDLKARHQGRGSSWVNPCSAQCSAVSVVVAPRRGVLPSH